MNYSMEIHCGLTGSTYTFETLKNAQQEDVIQINIGNGRMIDMKNWMLPTALMSKQKYSIDNVSIDGKKAFHDVCMSWHKEYLRQIVVQKKAVR